VLIGGNWEINKRWSLTAEAIRQGNIRIEAWSELTTNDYLYVGNELMKIQALPTHPDADCNFFQAQGQRIGYLDTTPTHHANNTPMYKVTLHPPGTKENPLDTQSVNEKARLLMAPVLGAEQTEGVIRRVNALEALADVRELRPFLARAGLLH
jgi:hypothetical protein